MLKSLITEIMRSVAFIMLYLVVLIPVFANDNTSENFIRNTIEHIRTGNELNINNVKILCRKAISIIYEKNDFKQIWDATTAESLISCLNKCEELGLKQPDYHFGYLKNKIKEAPPLSPETDLILTDAFLLLANHLINGKVDPVNYLPSWDISHDDVERIGLLERFKENKDIPQWLTVLQPKYSAYFKLIKALGTYVKIKESGGWKTIPEGPFLKLGEKDKRIEPLRERLIVTGDLVDDPKIIKDTFDLQLQKAVLNFQKRHGLAPDGVVGPLTINELNIPVEDRINQIKVNLERWRWLPEDLGNHYIIVNIADFKLEVYKGKKVMEKKVIVGRTYRKTPVFTARLSHIVFNPTWTVPGGIMKKDVLPEVKKDVHYLKSKNLKVIKGDNEVIDPSTVDWQHITSENNPYTFMQPPGLDNAMGVVKFMFPNPYNVYMHDTPSKDLFDANQRTFSSGCIRIQEPLDLAEHLLADTPGWNREAINKIFSSGKSKTVYLDEEIMVHIQYWTCWVDENDQVQFRKDIYHKDTLVENALSEALPNL